VSAWFGPYFGKDEKHWSSSARRGSWRAWTRGSSWKVAAPPPAEKGMTDKWFSNVGWDPKGDIFYISRMGKPHLNTER
jgi:hypothetical protein